MSVSAVDILPVGSEIGDEEFAEIATILSMRRGFELSVYKDKCMKRRVAIRIRATRSTAADYCCLLRQSEQELDHLVKALTIHVSHFFRNPSTYDTLRDSVLPELFGAAAERDAKELNLWCLGCAGGEEPYSLAILLRGHFADMLQRFRVAITGTDIDDSILAAAERAEYGEDRLKEVPDALRRHYFDSGNGRFQLLPTVRDMVTFVRKDIAALTTFPVADLVMCRNTLIYFTRADQERILLGISAGIPPGGFLVLGRSETLVGEARRHFSATSLAERIYRRI